jgi:hypothetical protein
MQGDDFWKSPDFRPERQMDKKYDQCMNNAKTQETAKDYNKFFNNCTSSIQSCLIQSGVELPSLSVTRSILVQMP